MIDPNCFQEMQLLKMHWLATLTTLAQQREAASLKERVFNLVMKSMMSERLWF
jgi:hypothetical protein